MSGNGGAPVNVDGGASGSSSGSISLSQGGLIAIIIVVVIVVIFGTGVTVLYFLAKRRQWKLRESLARASRRLKERKARNGGVTPRPSRSATAADRERQTKRAGMMNINTSTSKGRPREVVSEMRDVEKGLPDSKIPATTRTETTRSQK